MRPPPPPKRPDPPSEDRDRSVLRFAIIFDKPEAWKIIAIWDLACAMRREEKGNPVDLDDSGNSLMTHRLQNLTGLAREDCNRWSRILLNVGIIDEGGNVDKVAADFIRAKMSLEIDPDSKKGATS